MTNTISNVSLTSIVILCGLAVMSNTPTGIEVLASMYAYQIWDLFIKVIGSIGTIIAGIAVYWKFHKEKNRQMYENRLKEVYAPLIKLIIRQETFRKMFMRTSIEEAPILTIISTTSTLDFRDGEIIDVITRKKGSLDRQDFIKALNNTNYGLASPKLLSLIAQYELLVEYEDKAKEDLEDQIPTGYGTDAVSNDDKDAFENSEDYKKFKKIATRKVKVELSLLNEIVDRYNETICQLGLDKDQAIDIYEFSKEP